MFNSTLNRSLYDLESCQDYSIAEFFNIIDLEGYGYIDFDSVRLFLRDLNISLSEDEILAFIRRVNKYNSARITYDEFRYALENIYLPISASRRIIDSTDSQRRTIVEYDVPLRRTIIDDVPIRRTVVDDLSSRGTIVNDIPTRRAIV